ncbi:MAG: 3,4-dihydroxy-2-butanone-4-phosphate synthase [Ignavibacteria bacterium]|nr:3,4-dihydroxy-2-butanone-4-phosphate synthase [Ignavibacteria bacterium]
MHGTTAGISRIRQVYELYYLLLTVRQSRRLGRQGHIFPLRSAPGGVLRRAGHTEATVRSCKIVRTLS